MDDVILSKVESIERCIQRVNEEYFGFEEELATNFTKQDSIVLNLQRACELTIDLANYIIKLKQIGIPQTSRDSFEMLQEKGIISEQLMRNLKGMVGFRNIAVHNYKKLEVAVIQSIIKNNLQDFQAFCQIALSQVKL